MIDVEKFIRNRSLEIGNIFTNIANNGLTKKSQRKMIFTYELDVNKFDDRFANTINITENSDFSEMFTELKEHENYPALYFFSINKEITYSDIITQIEDVKLKLNKVTPVTNKYKDNLGILYIGKVKKYAWGRLIQHLGYHKNRKSHGLQLGYWDRKTLLDLNLTFTVMFFDEDIREYIQVLEKELAEKLKPLIGKHN